MSMPTDPRLPASSPRESRPALQIIRGGKCAVPVPTARVLAVASGKGGVGKTSLALNLALALAALDRRVLLVDGDLALGKLDLLLGEEPAANLGHVLNGECAVEQAIFTGPSGVRVLASPCGRDEFAVLDAARRERFCAAMARAATAADIVILDLATGIGPNSIELARRAGEIVVVTTPEPTASIDAYALIKILGGVRRAAPRIIVNRARSAEEAAETYARLARTASRHLHAGLVSWGHVLEDTAVGDAVRRQIPFLLGAPEAPASLCVREVARKLLCGDRPDETDRVPLPANSSPASPSLPRSAGPSPIAARREWEAA